MPKPSTRPSTRPSTKKALAQIRAHISASEFDQSLALSAALIEQDGGNYNAHIFHGLSLAALQRPADAVAAYERAAAISPDNPLAHKGLLAALGQTGAQDDPLRVARANSKLAVAAPDTAAASFPKACDAFFTLALEDAALAAEAVAVFRAARESGAVTPRSSYDDKLVYRIVKLLALDVPPPPRPESALDGGDPNVDGDAGASSVEGARQAQLNAPPLSEALDSLTDVLLRDNNADFYDGTADLVIERALNNALHDVNFQQHLSVLHKLHARDALLHLAETTLPTNLTKADCLRLANEAVQTSTDSQTNFDVSTTAKCILAAENYTTNSDLDTAISLLPPAKAPSTRSVPSQPKPSAVFRSCTHALVTAFFQLLAGECKFALETCKAGQALAAGNNHYQRMVMMLTLVSATAFRGERKYKSSTKAFDTVRDHARAVGDSWLQEAASRGLVDTAVVALGRTSRAAALAIEEAADTPAGILESLWSDALAGDIDLIRMKELTQTAVDRAKIEQGQESEALHWEYDLLHDTFCWSTTEVAAVASVRLAQMIVKEESYSRSALTAAQKHHMEAAGLRKGLCDPFAHLGFIFEQLYTFGDGDKMRMRAIRCYERALSMDAAHPVASRRLSRLFASRGIHDDAADVARQACDRNPQARWAFNMLGWHRVSRGEHAGAASAFQAALRGKLRRTTRVKEALFGTDVGTTVLDNDLVIDVDSWRGLSVAYQVQGKTRSAVGCLDDALGVLDKPTKAFGLADSAELLKSRKSWRVLVECEKNALLVVSRRSPVMTSFEMSIVDNDVRQPLIVGYTNAGVLMHIAAESWIKGSYREACLMREEAANTLQAWLDDFSKLQPEVNRAPLLKTVGDMWMEAASETTNDVARLMSDDFVERSLSKALHAYSAACHVSPLEREIRVQDMAAVLLRQAVHFKDEDLAKLALRMLLSAQAESTLVAAAFVTVASLSSSAELKKASRDIVARLSSEKQSRGVKHLLDASLAVGAQTSEEVDVYAAAAIRAAREDPTDWRAWYAIGKVREVDAERHGWDIDMVKSCEQANGEAERLGGGVAAANGMLRCIVRRLNELECDGVDASTYASARLALSLVERVGAEEPIVCRKIVDSYQAEHGLSDCDEMEQPQSETNGKDGEVEKAAPQEPASC